MTHYLIYKITNKLNDKIYIGKHKTDNLDDGYMGSGTAIRHAVKKYGIENFTKEILYDVDDEELMDFVEELLVDEAFVARKDTYNLTLGGRGRTHVEHSEETRRKLSEANKGKHHSEESKKKMSEAKKGFRHSEETKKKMSNAQSGHPGYMKGKHHTEESRRKISEANSGRSFSEEHKQNIFKHHADVSGERHPLYGKHHKEESRKKMSEARKRYWAKKKTA